KVHEYLAASGFKAKHTLEARTPSGRRRLFTKPSWDLCKAKALEEAVDKARKKNKLKKSDPAPKVVVSQNAVARKYYSQWGKIERDGKNTPIQGANADLIKVAFELLWYDLETVFGAYLVNTVHDEIVIECPEAVAQSCMEF